MARHKRKSAPAPVDKVTGLEPAFASAPSRIGKYVLYIKRDGQFVAAQIFAAKYSTRKFIDQLVEGYAITLQTDTLLKAGNLTLRCSLLLEVMEHVLTPAEQEWELPHPYPESIRKLRLGSDYAYQPRNTPATPDGPRPTPSPSRPKERKPKVSRDNLIGIAQIAEEIGMSPREARGILRKSDLPKPEAGWAWTEGLEVNQVKTLLLKK